MVVVDQLGYPDDIVAAAPVDKIDGPGLIRARAFVDATGDAELVLRAGGAVRDLPVRESMTKSILLRLGGVEGWDRAALTKRCRQLHEAGETPFANQGQFMGMAMINPGEVSLNFTLVVGDGLSARELTRLDAELREQAITTVDWFREHMPGSESAFLMEAAPRIGVRAGRTIVGHRTLTVEDVESGGQAAEPFAITAVRLMATCMATGQAAGIAAALAVRDDRNAAAVPYAEVRSVLLEQDAILA